MASTSVSDGHKTPPVISEALVPTSTVAASVVSLAMVPAAANPMPDPRRVVTSLVPDRVEELLRKYGLISTWNHIIVGLHEGFNVGI